MNWENTYLGLKNQDSSNGSNVNENRQKAFNNFLEKGLPTKSDEAWKYTSLSTFNNIQWSPQDKTDVHLTHEQLREISNKLPSDFINFVFVNGVLNQTLSDDSDDLILINETDDCDYSSDVKNVEARLLNLAQTFLTKKIKISVPKNKTVPKPVQIVFIQTSKKPIYSSEKLDLHLSENAELVLLINTFNLLDTQLDSQPDFALNLNINIHVSKSARLTFVQLQNENFKSFHFSQCQIEVESSAHVLSLVSSLGSKLIRNYFHLKFIGERAFAGIYGLGILNSSQHLDNYTFIQHAIGNNESIQHYKSILSETSRSAFRGRVLIEANAQKANSEQLNNNLLLTSGTQADSIPQLEIYADDVKAGHGSTFGQLNKDEIFYLLSRGINQYQATKLLSYGFAKDLLFKIENTYLQNYLNSTVNQKLEQMVQNV